MRSLCGARELAWSFYAQAGYLSGSITGGHHARHPAAWPGGRILRAAGRLCRRLRPGVKAMLELVMGGATAAGLLAYLLWALLRPEEL